jgi:sugar lactone lactonase YvrE
MPGTAAADLTFVDQFGGGSGSGPGQFANPDDLAVDSAGNIYIPDGSNHRVQVFNADGQFLRQFGTFGSDAGELANPNAVAVDSDGNAYVADRSNARVMQFDKAGVFVKGWGWGVDSAADAFQTCTAASLCEIGTSVNSGTKNGGFFNPHAIAVNAGGGVYVSEAAGDQRVQAFDPTTPIVSYFTGWGAPGSQPGQFARPFGLALDSASNVFVADRDNSRVQKFTSTGSFLQTIGSPGNGDGQLNTVEDVAVDRGGDVWVAESTTKRISKFTPDGAFLASYASPLPGAGTFSPAAIIFGPLSDLYVLDSSSAPIFRIIRFRETFRPDYGKLVRLDVVKGKVFVKVPAGSARASGSAAQGSGFVPLTEARTVPVRSILDTTRGTVKLTAARNKAGKTQSGQFTAGVFQVLQSRKAKAKGLTELVLKGSSFKGCSGAGAKASLSNRTIRRLRGSANGRYRTRGRHSAATVRGTKWTVSDRCDGTLTKVKQGKVEVTDFRLKETILLGAGKSYLARAAR